MVKDIINIRDISPEEYDRYFLLMSPEKQQRVERFRFEDGKKRTVAGEMLARKMINSKKHIDEEKIIFKTGANGKPYTKSVDICFNISHSDELVLCAVSETPIGVDIEKIRDINSSVIKYSCNEKELGYVYEDGISKEESLKRFFEVWTYKEACFKFKGTGIDDFQSLDFFKCKRKKEQGIIDNYVYCIIF